MVNIYRFQETANSYGTYCLQYKNTRYVCILSVAIFKHVNKVSLKTSFTKFTCDCKWH